MLSALSETNHCLALKELFIIRQEAASRATDCTGQPTLKPGELDELRGPNYVYKIPNLTELTPEPVGVFHRCFCWIPKPFPIQSVEASCNFIDS